MDKQKINRINDINRNSLLKLLYPTYLQLFSDILFIIISYSFYYYLKYHSGIIYNITTPNIEIFVIPLLFLIIYWLTIFWFSGLYKNWYNRSIFDEIFTLIRITFFGSFFIFILVFVDSYNSPRPVFLIYNLLILVGLVIGRLICRRIQKRIRTKEILNIPSIIIGNYKKAIDLEQKLRLSKSWGYRSLGIVLFNKEDEYLNNENVLGTINNIEKIIENVKPEEVLFSVDSPNRTELVNIVNQCADKGLNVKIVPDMYDIFMGSVKTFPLYGIPLIEINTQLMKPWEEYFKRFIDILISLIVLILGLPFWIIISILIKIESKGPVFYIQERVGKDSRIFKIIKFRTMVHNPVSQGSIWTQVNDPRVTKFGSFLRKSHLDEFPQFWNVLKGEMSIVGPRPEQFPIVEKYNKLIPYYKRRLIVRPGITGWWQVQYKTYEETQEEIEGRLKDDFYYIENISIQLDLEIMVRTIFHMIKGQGQT